MKCTTCGAELETDATFCANCGTRAPLPATSAGQQTVQLGDPYMPPQARVPPTVPVEGEVVPVWSGSAGAANPISSLAIISLVCGILGIIQILPFIGPIAAIITGHMARREIQASHGAKTGNGMAMAGLITGYVTLGLYALLCVLGVVFVLVFGYTIL